MPKFKIRCRCNRRHGRRKEPPIWPIFAALGSMASAVGGAIGGAATAIGGALGIGGGAAAGAGGLAAGSLVPAATTGVGAGLAGSAGGIGAGALGSTLTPAMAAAASPALSASLAAAAPAMGAIPAGSLVGGATGAMTPAMSAALSATSSSPSWASTMGKALSMGQGGGGGKSQNQPQMILPSQTGGMQFGANNLNSMMGQNTPPLDVQGGRPWISRDQAVRQMSPISQQAAGTGTAPGQPGSQMPENKGKAAVKKIMSMKDQMGGGKMQQQPYEKPPMAPFQTPPPVPQMRGATAWVPRNKDGKESVVKPWWWYLSQGGAR